MADATMICFLATARATVAIRILVAVFCACVFSVGCSGDSATGVTDADQVTGSTDQVTGTVTVEFYFGDSNADDAMQSVDVDYVSNGATIESVMQKIESPAIMIEGSGVTAFVSEIEGLKTTKGEGWTYRVNDEFVPLGIGTATVQPPTTITWRHGPWEESVGE